jgi:hypothetical protein
VSERGKKSRKLLDDGNKHGKGVSDRTDGGEAIGL